MRTDDGSSVPSESSLVLPGCCRIEDRRYERYKDVELTDWSVAMLTSLIHQAQDGERAAAMLCHVIGLVDEIEVEVSVWDRAIRAYAAIRSSCPRNSCLS